MNQFSKFDLHSTNPIEMGAKTMETLHRLVKEHEEFTRCITTIVSDYIKLCDDKILEAQLYMKKAITNIKEMVERGELTDEFIEAFYGPVMEELETLKGDVEALKDNMPYYIYNEETEELTLMNIPTKEVEEEA